MALLPAIEFEPMDVLRLFDQQLRCSRGGADVRPDLVRKVVMASSRA